ncbi:F0F1 ATP synthase subunit delta [Nitrosophilus alvini]|uniref:F0F1 ATP synthase subunit delta n=1 Tax=Nitrosophilus alvini TaxID=2714855 RepID=UPI001909C8F2|nr:F0F1 ATP synthase subunit delta [Nitrosophilus alvini]
MFDWWSFGFQLINFFVVLFILYRLLFRPVKNIIEKRERYIKDKIEEIEKKEKEVQKLLEEYKKRVKEAEELKKRAIKEAKEEALKEKKRILKEAKEEAAKEFEKTKAILLEEENRILQNIKKRSREFAILYTENLLSSIADENLHKITVKKFIKKLSSESFKELEQIKKKIQKRECKAEIISAFGLDSSEQEEILSKLEEILGCSGFDIESKTDPSLIAGVKIRIEGLSLDGSLRGMVEKIAESIGKEK